jgi:hypothetical protein
VPKKGGFQLSFRPAEASLTGLPFQQEKVRNNEFEGYDELVSSQLLICVISQPIKKKEKSK